MVYPLKSLAAVVNDHFKELRIAEALEAIISQLKAVRLYISHLMGSTLTVISRRSI